MRLRGTSAGAAVPAPPAERLRKAPSLSGDHITMRLIGIMSRTIFTGIASYNSPGYQEALKALGDGAERDLRIVAGWSRLSLSRSRRKRPPLPASS
jgi:hypothetical protein